MQAEYPIVVTINVLGLRIDMPNIRAVIYIDGP